MNPAIVKTCAETVAPTRIRDNDNCSKSFWWVEVYLHEMDRKSWGPNGFLSWSPIGSIGLPIAVAPRLPVQLVQVNIYPPETPEIIITVPDKDGRNSLCADLDKSRGGSCYTPNFGVS